MFESLEDAESKVRVELYIEKVPTYVGQYAVELVSCSNVGISSEKTTSTHSSEIVRGSTGYVSSGSSSRTLLKSSANSEGYSRASSDYTDNEIPYYKSFDGSSMIVSDDEDCLKKASELHNPSELAKGGTFESKENLMNVVRKVHIANHQEIKVLKSDSMTWEVVCKQNNEGCRWRLRARKRKIHDSFEIMKIEGPHTCLNQSITQDHCNLSSSHIVEIIINLLAVDPNISEKVLTAAVVKEVGYTPSEKKLKMVAIFKRVFWTFKPCIDAFVNCIPVLQIDGTHLYSKYGGVLLTATAVDGFHHILPVAFAIVESENIASWSWFMDRVKKLVVCQRTCICVISDKHSGIMSAMNNPNLGWCEPNGYHRYCVRHLAANFGKAFKQNGLKERVVAMCSQLTKAKFNLHWKSLLAFEPRADEWFSGIHPKHSALSCDGGKRFGIMTTNIAESWNNAIKKARKLPITALVKALYYKVVSYFDQRRVEIEKQGVDGNEFTKYANKIMNKWKERASGHHVTKIDRIILVFEVVTMKRGLKGGKKQIVRLQDGTCTCNKWQTYQIPCSHVFAACANVGLQHTRFVSDWYKLEKAKLVYGGQFEAIPDRKAWPLLRDFPTLTPDDDIPKKPGRRKSTRGLFSGFGDVYRAQLKDGSVVAIKKLIHVGGQGDQEF
ncbi:hypothetical protein AgCh_028121 [Apium graveolens]